MENRWHLSSGLKHPVGMIIECVSCQYGLERVIVRTLEFIDLISILNSGEF